MARHRKIDVRMRSDERFRALSAPPPNGQDCWIHLLTNKYTTSIPGVYHAFEETLARDIGWPLEGYRKAFAEVLSKSMAKYDHETGLIFIAKAFRYNQPESPNVVRSWRTHWDELPECRLKDEAALHLKASLEGISKAFSDAFEEGTPKPTANQEQEQEQEKTFPAAAPRETSSGLKFDFEAVYAAYPRKLGRKKGLQRCRSGIKTQAKYDSLLAAVKHYTAFVAGTEDKFIKHFDSFMSAWEDWITPPSLPSGTTGRAKPAEHAKPNRPPLLDGPPKYHDETEEQYEARRRRWNMGAK